MGRWRALTAISVFSHSRERWRWDPYVPLQARWLQDFEAIYRARVLRRRVHRQACDGLRITRVGRDQREVLLAIEQCSYHG